MSKSVKKILTVAAAIAVAYFAPAVAGALLKGTAAAGSVAAMTVTSAAVNAAGNAAIAAATGGDVGKAAIAGAISGGIGGYTQASQLAAARTAAGNAPVEVARVGATGAPAAGVAAPATAATTVGTTAGATSAGLSVPLEEAVVQASRGTSVGSNASWEGTKAAVTAGLSDAAATQGNQPTQGATTTASPAATESPGLWQRMKSSDLGQAVAKRLTPEKMADFTLRAAGQIAGSYIAGSGLSAEEESLLAQQRAELEQLRTTNMGLFNQRLQAAQDMLGSAKYFDPEYFGLQSARRARLAGVQAEREGTRGLTGTRLAAEQRRYRLGTARNVGTAYDIGYGEGVSGRRGALQVGLQLMPSSAPSSISESTMLGNMYTNRANRRDSSVGNIGDLFGSITGRDMSRRTGDEEQQEG